MKKKNIFAVALFIVSSCCEALPLGNPADPLLFNESIFCIDAPYWNPYCSFRFGYYGDFVFNRHVERASGPDSGDAIEHCRIFTNSALLVATVCKKVDVFATLGETSIRIDTNSFSGPYLDHEYRSRFSWSVGGRAVVWQWERLAVGLEGQYFSFNPHTTRLTFGGDTTEFPSDARARAHEWQIGVGTSWRIAFFVPYIGIKWSRLFIDNNDALVLGSLIPDFRSRKLFGYAFGVALVDCSVASLNVEGRFADEKALSVMGQISF